MTQKGVWNLQDVRDENLAGNWSYTSNDPYTIFAWGDNGSGQLGQNSLVSYSSPTQIAGTEWSQEIKQQPIMLKTDGTAWAWGYAYYGTLGLNDTVRRSSPTQIPGTQWSSVAKTGSYRISTAFKTDGSLWMWGSNSEGTLGLNDKSNRSSPIQLPGTWKHISAGENHIFGTTTSGELYWWGRGNSGVSGQNVTNIIRSSPKQIPGTQWDKPFASTGTYSGFFTKTDGTLWAVGANDFGILGQNSAVNYSSPRQIPGTSWHTITAGTQGVIATKSDGTLWGWGTNTAGTIGINDAIHRSSPTQIPGTNWALGYNRVARPFYSTVALKTDGTMWAWGQNNSGQHASNNTVIRSSPYQIPGTQWTRVADVYQSSFVATKNS